MSKEEEENLLFLSFDGKTFFLHLLYVCGILPSDAEHVDNEPGHKEVCLTVSHSPVINNVLLYFLQNKIEIKLNFYRQI